MLFWQFWCVLQILVLRTTASVQLAPFNCSTIFHPSWSYCSVITFWCEYIIILMNSIFVSIHSYLTFLLLCVFLFLTQRNRKHHSILQEKIICLSEVHNKYKWQVCAVRGCGHVRNAINYLLLIFWPRISNEVSAISEHKCVKIWATIFSFLSFIVIRVRILSCIDFNSRTSLVHELHTWASGFPRLGALKDEWRRFGKHYCSKYLYNVWR